MDMTRDEWNEYCRIMALDDLDAMRVYLRILEEKKNDRKNSLLASRSIDGCCGDGSCLGDHDGNKETTEKTYNEMGETSRWMEQIGGD